MVKKIHLFTKFSKKNSVAYSLLPPPSKIAHFRFLLLIEGVAYRAPCILIQLIQLEPECGNGTRCIRHRQEFSQYGDFGKSKTHLFFNKLKINHIKHCSLTCFSHIKMRKLVITSRYIPKFYQYWYFFISQNKF